MCRHGYGTWAILMDRNVTCHVRGGVCAVQGTTSEDPAIFAPEEVAALWTGASLALSSMAGSGLIRRAPGRNCTLITVAIMQILRESPGRNPPGVVRGSGWRPDQPGLGRMKSDQVGFWRFCRTSALATTLSRSSCMKWRPWAMQFLRQSPI